LKSLKQIFAKIPPGHGGAFVLIQHLDPSRENLTVRLLKDLAALAVVEAADGMPVLADRIHVIPPDKFLSITGSRLTFRNRVMQTAADADRPLLCSWPWTRQSRGCGIVLSALAATAPWACRDQSRGRQDAGGSPETAEFRTCRKVR
jgi:hypothetical protein